MSCDIVSRSRSLAERVDAFHEIVQSLGGLTGVDGESYERFTDLFRVWELASLVASLLKCCRPVQWVVVGPEFDAALVEHGVHEIYFVHPEALGVEHDGIQMERMLALRHDSWQR